MATAEDHSLKLRGVNLGLLHIGHSLLVRNWDEGTKHAEIANYTVDTVLKSVLRAHPWPFATKYQSPMTLKAGTTSEAVNDDWQFAYYEPSDCVFARRITQPGIGRMFNPTPFPFRMGREGDDKVVYCNLEDAGLEYTAIFDCPVALADPLFVRAFSWAMAAVFAPSLAQNKLTARDCEVQFLMTIETAKAVAQQEQQQEAPGEASAIRARD